MSKLYVALELNLDGTINDIGPICNSPTDAWQTVEDTFDASDTVISELVPRFKVKQQLV